MNKMLIILSMLSISLCGTVYLGMDLSADYDLSGKPCSYYDCDGGFSDKSFVLGYNHPVYQKDKYGFAVGGSYMMKDLGHDFGLGEGDHEFNFMSLYGMVTYPLNDDLMLWDIIGYNKFEYDGSASYAFDEKGGLTYGFGVHYKVDDTFGVGLGYIVNNAELDANGQLIDGEPATDIEVKTSRFTIVGSYAF